MNKSSTKELEISCPVCRNNRGLFTGKPKFSSQVLRFIRNNYSVVQCTNCGYYFICPKIDFTDDEWKRLYNLSYFTEMTIWHQKQRNTDIRNRFVKLKSYCDNNIENFLDMGCGEGLALIEAGRQNWISCGIDISDNRTEEAKDKDINFISGNIFSAKLPDNFFDCVYMDSVLEHLIDPVSYLKEINRILKKAAYSI